MAFLFQCWENSTGFACRSNNTGAIDVKIHWSLLEEKSSFFPRTARLWNFLPIEWFPLAYNLNVFKSSITRDLLTLVSF